MKLSHVIEKNAICHLLLLKMDIAHRTFSYYRKYLFTTFSQIQK